MFADTDLRQVAEACQVDGYPAGLEQAVGGSQTGSWMYTGALENHPGLIDRWQRLRPLLGNPAEVLRRVRDPELVGQTLRTAGLAAPAVRSAGATLPRDGTWLAKPRRSAGGARISRLDEQWRDPSTTPDEYYFQQAIAGKSVAAVYLATTHDLILLGVTEQLCGAAWGGGAEFQYCGSIGPRQFAPPITDQFHRIGEALHRAFALTGLFGVDAIVEDDTVWPVEVNPRYTASVEVIERATAFEAVAAHVTACREGTLLPIPVPRQQSGKLIVWARQKCFFPGSNHLPSELLADIPNVTLADIPAARTVIDAGGPIATVLADAECVDSVTDRLISRAAALQECCPGV